MTDKTCRDTQDGVTTPETTNRMAFDVLVQMGVIRRKQERPDSTTFSAKPESGSPIQLAVGALSLFALLDFGMPKS